MSFLRRKEGKLGVLLIMSLALQSMFYRTSPITEGGRSRVEMNKHMEEGSGVAQHISTSNQLTPVHRYKSAKGADYEQGQFLCWLPVDYTQIHKKVGGLSLE